MNWLALVDPRSRRPQLARQARLIPMRQRQTDMVIERNQTAVRRTIVRVIVVCGLMLALSVCSTRNVMDIVCPPAGQCPNVSSGHGGGY